MLDEVSFTESRISPSYSEIGTVLGKWDRCLQSRVRAVYPTQPRGPQGSDSLDPGKTVIFRDKRQSLQVGAWGSARACPLTGGHGKEVGKGHLREVGQRELWVGFPSP